MASPRSDILALYVRSQGATLDDPDEDGSSYTPIPAFNISDLPDGQTPEATTYADGSNWPSNPTVGQEDVELSFDTDAGGLLTSPADAASVTDDWHDILLMHTYGSATNMTRAQLGADEAAAQSVISMTSGASRVAGDPVCFYQAGHARAQFARVGSVASNDWTVSPPLEYDLTAASAFSRALRVYREILGGGDRLCFAHVRGPEGDQDIRTLLTARLKKLTITVATGKKTVISWGFRASRQVFGGKADLPAPVLTPAFTPIKGDLSPVFIDGVSMGHVSSVVIDLMPMPLRIDSVHGDSAGRGGDEMGKLTPKITINPVHAEDYYEDVRAAAHSMRVLVQIGAGNGDGDPINAQCMLFDNMGPVKAAPEKAAEGLLRTKLELTARHPGTATGAHFVQHIRA
jgi:hypothetical protein